MPAPGDYVGVNDAELTPRTAPPRIFLTFAQRNGPNVLVGEGLLLLVGPYGVNYWAERSDDSGLYLRRWDILPDHGSASVVRGPGG